MDEIDRRILEYLSSKDKIAFAAMSDQTGIPGEVVEIHLSATSLLIKEDFVRVEWPYAGAKFAHITEGGRKSLWDCKKRMIHYFLSHWVELCILFLTIVLLFKEK